MISNGHLEDPLRDVIKTRLSDYAIFSQNKVMLLSIKDFLEKSAGCFKALQELENAVSLKPYSLIFALRLFEKARYNLCQVNYSAEHFKKLIGDDKIKIKRTKITRRWQEFEESKEGGQTSMINSCLRSVQFFKYGNKEVGKHTGYE